MKKYLFLAAALIAMGCGMSNCSNEVDVTEQTEQAPKLTKLVFTVAQDAETRATWGGTYNRTPMFEDGDKVSLFSASNDNVKLTAHVSGSTVTLTGEGISGDTNLYFVYPWDANATIEDGKISSKGSDYTPYNFGDVELNPGVDKYPSNALSLAKSIDGGASAITFQGLTTIIKFTPTTNCKGYISIDAYDDDLIPHDRLAINTAESKIGYADTKARNLYLPAENHMYDFEADKSYYFALPPFTMLSGGKISFTDATDEDTAISLYTATADEGKAFVAGKIYNLKYTPETTGSTKATIGGSVVNVPWVQLWKNGPKFAERNVGASSATGLGTTMSFTDAAKTGADYVWGTKWCTPCKADMDELLKAATSVGSQKVTCTYGQVDGVYGFRFTGKETGYTTNSVFFPAKEHSGSNGGAQYWSSTASGDNAWLMGLRNVTGGWSSDWTEYPQTQDYLVRPVLK